MQEPKTWRELLRTIVNDPHQRQRISTELDVNQITLLRWANQDSKPRPQSLMRLLDALPEHREHLLTLIRAEYPKVLPTEDSNDLVDEEVCIPAALYARVHHTLALEPKEQRFWPLCNLIAEQALKQLDPHRQGMSIIITRCMPPWEQQVRSLREVLARGTPPWSETLDQLMLLGADSLAGYAVAIGRTVANQDLHAVGSYIPGYPENWEQSAAAAPLRQASRVAGSLLVSSTQRNYFTPTCCQLIESYANLIALAFESEAFYRPEQIALGLLPHEDVQRPHLAGFRQRLVSIMNEALRQQQPLTIAAAEKRAWQQLEADLLREVLFSEKRS